jgi:hypothetical protein
MAHRGLLLPRDSRSYGPRRTIGFMRPAPDRRKLDSSPRWRENMGRNPLTQLLGARGVCAMSHEFRIDCEAGLLKEAFSGLLSLDVLTESNVAIFAHLDFTEGLSFLTDLRNAQIPFGYNEMNAHVHTLPRLRISKQAFIVTHEAEYGMIRMFITLTEDSDIYDEAKIFRSIEEGMKWLTS